MAHRNHKTSMPSSIWASRTGSFAAWLAVVWVSLMPSCKNQNDPEQRLSPGQSAPLTFETSPPIDENVARPPFAVVPRPNPKLAAKRPKAVVFLLIDTFRFSQLGCYGSNEGLTPVIDSLATRSVLFRNAIAPSSWTRASIASIFTSRYPTATGCRDRVDQLTQDNFTIAEVLKTYGDFLCCGVCSNGNAGEAVGFAQGFDWFRTPPLSMRRKYPDDPREAMKIPGDTVNRIALRITEDLVRESNKDRSLFLWLHYVDPHDPYFPNESAMAGPEPAGRWSGSRLDLDEMDRLSHTHQAIDRERIKHLYRGEVKFLDQKVGELLLSLNDVFGSLDDVMLILTADHGEGLWEHGFRAHGCDLYEEQIRVPLLVHWPGMSQDDAKTIDQPVSLVDLGPTILAACGIEQPPSYQGKDLAPLAFGKTRGVAHDFIYSELTLDGRDMECLRGKRYKLIRDRKKPLGSEGSMEFYDLLEDPDEKVNILANPDLVFVEQYQAEITAFQDHLWHWSTTIQACSGSFERENPDLSSLDEETLRMLRGLGYIGAADLEGALKKKKNPPR